MFVEFFFNLDPYKKAFAWIGLVVFLGHALFDAYIKWRLNAWYESFYDVMQTSVSEFGSANTLTDAQIGFLEEKRGEVTDLLIEFAKVVAPILVVHPVCKYVSSVWRFQWRIALVEAYLAHYDASKPSLEGTAQRVQEDTSRFEEGVYTAFNVLLDSVLTLCIFLPLLLEQGRDAKPEWVSDDFDAWLAYAAVQASVSGLFISAWVGRKLVGLEVENQKVEAKLRTKLVILEESPLSLVEDSVLVAFPPDVEVVQAQVVAEDDGEGGASSSSMRVSPEWSPLPRFKKVVRELWDNYRALFLQYTWFNAWIAFFDQAMILFPYVVVAPLMFAEDPERRITLGQLVKITNAFGRVFGSLAVVSQSWASINDFRSTVRRLREFEKQVYARKKASSYKKIEELSPAAPPPPPRAASRDVPARQSGEGEEMHDVEL